jgi:hypothetical protein
MKKISKRKPILILSPFEVGQREVDQREPKNHICIILMTNGDINNLKRRKHVSLLKRPKKKFSVLLNESKSTGIIAFDDRVKTAEILKTKKFN